MSDGGRSLDRVLCIWKVPLRGVSGGCDTSAFVHRANAFVLDTQIREAPIGMW